jgi:hypothetical protein
MDLALPAARGLKMTRKRHWSPALNPLRPSLKLVGADTMLVRTSEGQRIMRREFILLVGDASAGPLQRIPMRVRVDTSDENRPGSRRHERRG